MDDVDQNTLMCPLEFDIQCCAKVLDLEKDVNKDNCIN